MSGKLVIFIILISFILLALAPICISTNSSSWWDDNWSFRQEICIPIDTGDEQAKYQPIDTYIEFDTPCWAKNEKEHSVRVIFQNSEDIKEIESQIYDLSYIDENHIKACSLVFLIPEEANGKEKYFVYYDDEKKTAPNYVDHVDVEESYYSYKPINGYYLESHYFKITEDGYVVYSVAKEGDFMGMGTAQGVTKLKAKSKKVAPQAQESIAFFDFMYYYGKGIEDYSSTVERLISKEIFVDGNIMVEFGVVSGSSREDLRTTAMYKYYYCPTEHKRMCVHVKHKALKECIVEPASNVDGNYAHIQCGGFKSNAVKELNFGKILPYIHVCSENNIVREYALDPDSNHATENHGVMILNTKDDVDIGEKAWMSFDEGETGVAHSLLLDSNSVVKSGTNEKDGVQVRARENKNLYSIGLESDMAFVSYGRNSYERGSSRDLEIPDDFVVEFDAEFFSTEKGGYKMVEKEAELYQSLIKMRPFYKKEISGDDKETGKCSLAVYLHMDPSFPLGSALSVVTGKNLSYINAELHRGKEFISSGIGERLSIKTVSSFDNTNLIEKIKLSLDMFDWRNLTFSKKICFPNLEPGTYLVKIYRENPLFGKERQYIGFRIVDVKEDTKTHIFCRSQGTINMSVFDQNSKGVKDVDVGLIYDNTIIFQDVTSKGGMATINAPCSFNHKYNLRLMYKGFIIHEELVKLGYIRNFVPIRKSINIELSDFNLKLKDIWGLTPRYKLNPILTSKEMEESILLAGERMGDGCYLFANLYPATYKLELQYESFLLEKDINIPNNKEEINIVFPAEFNIKTNTFDARGNPLKNAKILISREGIIMEGESDDQGRAQFSLPPGTYSVKVYYKNDLMGERKINVIGERTFDLITTEEPLFPLIVICAAAVFFLFGRFFTLRRKDFRSFFKILVVVLAIASVVSPWWMLQGSSSNADVETFTKVFLIPQKMVTTTITSNVTAGEMPSLLDIFTDAMSLLPIFIGIGCILIMLNIVFNRFNKNKLALLSLILGIVFLIGSFFIFCYGMSELAKVGVGSFIGEGNMDINIVGEGMTTGIYCHWGPSIGFYLCSASIILLLFPLFYYIIRELHKRFTKNV